MSQIVTWIVPIKDDVVKFIQQSVIDGSNSLNSGGEERLDGPTGILQAEIDRVRAAIDKGNRVPLSLTKNSIPPEARIHTMVLVANALVSSVPMMAGFAGADGLKEMWAEAIRWIDKLEKGELIVEQPTDPDPTTLPPGPEWGDYTGQEVNGVTTGKLDLSLDGI